MTRRTVVVIVNLLALALVAALAVAAKNHDNLPFKGTTQGTSQVIGISNGIVASASEGDLLATHLGRGRYEVQATQDYPRHVEGERPDRTGQCAFVDGTVELIAANGDQINGDIDADRSVVCAPDDQPPTGPRVGDVYYSTLYIDVTGGTGRFTDASGWIFSEGTSTIQVDGTTIDEADLFGDILY